MDFRLYFNLMNLSGINEQHNSQTFNFVSLNSLFSFRERLFKLITVPVKRHSKDIWSPFWKSIIAAFDQGSAVAAFRTWNFLNLQPKSDLGISAIFLLFLLNLVIRGNCLSLLQWQPTRSYHHLIIPCSRIACSIYHRKFKVETGSQLCKSVALCVCA